jgi:hypothetical protein
VPFWGLYARVQRQRRLRLWGRHQARRRLVWLRLHRAERVDFIDLRQDVREQHRLQRHRNLSGDPLERDPAAARLQHMPAVKTSLGGRPAHLLPGTALAIAIACSSSRAGIGSLGQPCSASAACVSGARVAQQESCYCLTDANGNCVQSDANGVCTAGCSDHFDCGCDANTTDTDIVAGKCAFACTLERAGCGGTCAPVATDCWRVCTQDSQCQGSTPSGPVKCLPTTRGYSVCQ